MGGAAFAPPPSRHTMENAGSAELRLVLIELK
jgi:hypothetical protein